MNAAISQIHVVEDIVLDLREALFDLIMSQWVLMNQELHENDKSVKYRFPS